MKKLFSAVLVFAIVLAGVAGVTPVSAASVKEIQDGADAMFAAATRMHLTDAITPTYDPVPQHIGDSNWDNECTALTYYSLLHLNIHKYTPYGNGNTWYPNFPAGKTNLGDYTTIKKSGETALKDLIKEYGNEIFYIMVGFSNGSYGHVMFIYAIKDNVCYYYDNFSDAHGTTTQRKEVRVDDFINSYKSYGYTFQGAIYFKSNRAVETASVTEGTFYLKCGDKYLTASDDWEGGNVTANAKNGSSAQQFRLYKNGSGYNMAVQSSPSGRVINTWTESVSMPGNDISLYYVTNHPTQIWVFEKSGSGYIIHPSDNLGAALTIQGDNSVMLSASSGASNQIWSFEDIVEEKQASVDEMADEKTENKTEYELELNAELIGNDEEAIGVKLEWSGVDSKYGYRIFRSESRNGERLSISDFAVFGEKYVDVNLDSHTKYYYTICPVEKDASFDMETGTLIAEQLGSSSDYVSITTPEITTEVNREKQFILMKVGSPDMLVGAESLEIDPGRGTTPIIQNGRTLVPIRAIIEAMGGSVDWNEAERKITLNANGHTVIMRLGEKEFTVDGQTKQMDIAPDIINDRTMLPIRFAAENLGCQVEWINSSREIVIVF
ncbi:MAG: stalk domain-containing protein [Clostridia bacterium]|nr:stalk domain-containing protein [Clostridia bacterium]